MAIAIPKTLISFLACLSLAANSVMAAVPVENAHPTIRVMSGAVQLDRLDPASTALVVIDFQNEYFTGQMPIPDGQQAMTKARELVAFADQAKIPVYHIQHIAPAGSAVFALDGEGVNFHPLMQPRAGATVQQNLRTGQLVHILPGYSLGQRHYYALYPHAKHLAPKVRAFIEFMAQHYKSLIS